MLKKRRTITKKRKITPPKQTIYVKGFCKNTKPIARKKHYKIIQTNSIIELEKNVKESMMNGWEPLGGVSEQKDHPRDASYLQSMIKRTKN